MLIFVIPYAIFSNLLSNFCPNFNFREIPIYKQRIAGKSIPVEKFVIAKAERSLDGGRLPLCGLVRKREREGGRKGEGNRGEG